jgi:hypothetical protein
MHVLRHDYIAEDVEDIALAHLFERALEQLTGWRGG